MSTAGGPGKDNQPNRCMEALKPGSVARIGLVLLVGAKWSSLP